jgi:hypothetical protein
MGHDCSCPVDGIDVGSISKYFVAQKTSQGQIHVLAVAV